MNSNTSGAAVAMDHQLTASEREQAHVYLQQTQNGITGAIKGLSAAQWNFTSAPDRWSIAGVVEHVIFVYDRVLGPAREQLAKAPPPPADRDHKLVDSIILAQFPNRLAKFPAPEMSHPAGRFTSPAEAIASLQKAYEGLNEYVESPDLRQHALEAAPIKAITKGVYDSMDAYQWILAASAHCERHTKQILEIRADPNFPAA
jgi:hypothetical protein